MNLPSATPEPINGAQVLAQVETFLSRFVAYPSEAARVAHTLWIGHTWFMDQWDSTPRIAFLSPEPGSGKSRALEVTEPLVPRPVHAVNVSASYLFRKVSDEDGRPTILYDEIDTVFGPKAKENEDLRGLLNAGHRKGATAGRCEVHGKKVQTVDYPAYCAVALAGLDDLPDTLMTRSVVIRMRRRSPDEKVEPWRMRLNGADGEAIGDQLAEWANAEQNLIQWPEMPEGIEDRNADVWEALIAVADLAGGDWPDRARVSAVSLVTQSQDRTGSLGVMLLRDIRAIFTKAGADRLPTETILEELHQIDESPWGDIRGKALDARGLARRLGKYQPDAPKPKVYRDGMGTVRGYEASDFRDLWSRYLSQSQNDDSGTASAPLSDVTSETSDTAPDPVTAVTQVTDTSETKGRVSYFANLPGRCASCGFHVDAQGHADDCREAS